MTDADLRDEPAGAGFAVLGDPAAPAGPVVVSVPHAGRAYPPALLALLRVPAAALAALEDRHVDAVARAAWAGGAEAHGAALIQRRGRAWVDLNRAEDERDPAVDEGAGPAGAASARVAAGLGLVPRRAGRAGELWRRRLTAAEVERRLAEDHRPYHAALAAALAAARARWGAAVLLDLHSMPPLAGPGAALAVVGDRWGRAAGGGVTARAVAVLRGAGWPVAVNRPYAGGHVLDRHGRPAAVHGVQVELCRSCYLDAGLDRPGPGLAATAALVARLVAALADEVTRGAALAAE